MSCVLYDNAIIADLRRLTQDTRIYIEPTENVFGTVGKLQGSEDHIQLPLISVARTGWSILNPQHTQKFDGALLKSDLAKDYTQRIQVIPIQINYVLDVWSRTREENDDILRELIFYYNNHPEMEITVPYGADFKHKFNIFFKSG